MAYVKQGSDKHKELLIYAYNDVYTFVDQLQLQQRYAQMHVANATGYMQQNILNKVLTNLNKSQPSTKGSSSKGVGNPVEIAGRGNTGRTTPNTLTEQVAMHEVQSNPLKKATQLPFKMSDSRWLGSEGWVKMQSVVKDSQGKTVIHFVYNTITGEFDDFKFK